MQSNNDNIRLRMRVMAFLLIPVAIGVGIRFYVVQVRDHDEYLSKAQSRYTAKRVTKGRRGEVFDVKGNLLIGNAPSMNITCDPQNLRDDLQRRKLAFLLSRTLDEDYTQLYQKLAPYAARRGKDGSPLLNPDGTPEMRSVRYVVIGKNLPVEIGRKIKNLARANRIRALFFEDSYMRTYPKGRLLANILGFTNVVDDRDVAVIGIEKTLNEEMKPESGVETFERSRDGRPLNYRAHEFLQSRDGNNIYLTIDEPLQSILEEELDKAYEKWRPDTLYAAIADPKTGNILAIAQRPTFDPNDRRGVTPDAWRVKITEDGLEPGSVIKPFSIGKALDWGYVRPETPIDCDKGCWIYLNKRLTDSHPYDKLTVAQVIQKSSNIGTAKVALLLGEEKVFEALTSFGFGQRSGLPIRPESRGILPPIKRWDGLSITRFPIGYGILVTPVQILRAYCALANHGMLPKLRLVDRVVNPENGEVVSPPPEPPKPTFLNPAAHSQLVEMMITVTEPGGTARQAAIPGYHVAGKTGTSRKNIRGHYVAGKYFASFCGFVPARDPRFVMLVTMDTPRGAIYGGTVSGPVFRAVMERALRYYNIPPDIPPADALPPASGKKLPGAPSAVPATQVSVPVAKPVDPVPKPVVSVAKPVGPVPKPEKKRARPVSNGVYSGKPFSGKIGGYPPMRKWEKTTGKKPSVDYPPFENFNSKK